MSFTSKTQFEERITSLGDHTGELNADVENFTKALQLHDELMRKERSSARGILKKEIGGSIWEYGGEGKLRDYRSSRYSDDAGKPPPKPSGAANRRLSSKSGQPLSKTRIVNGTSREKGGKEKHQKLKASACTIEPSIKKAANKRQTRQTAKEAKTQDCHQKHHLLNSDSDGDDDAEIIASRYSHSKVNLNETYTKDASGKSPFSLPTASGKNVTVQKDCSENSADKRSKVLKKMIRKLDVDLKLGEYKTSETDSDSLCTSQQADPECTNKSSYYCDPDVLAWLMNQGLKYTEKYARIFSENKIDMTRLMLLEESQLREMGITASGALMKLTNAIQSLKKASARNSHQQVVDAVASLPKHQHHITNHSRTTDKSTPKTGKKSTMQTSEVESHPGFSAKQGSVSHSSSAKNSAKSSSRTSKKCPSSHRPQSAVLNTNKLPHKHQSKARPASAHLTKAETNPDKNSTHGKVVPSEEQNREHTSKKKETTLSSLIAVRSLVANSVQVPETNETERPHAITNSETSCSEAESRLQFIEQQIHELQKELMSPAALEIISSLQTQLQEIQNEVLKKKVPTQTNAQSSTDEKHGKKPTFAKCSEAIADNQKLRKSSNDDDPVASGINEKDAGATMNLSKTKVINPKTLSISLSKTELLREVRKQNEAHRKHIRQLESELSRLKYKDPMRNCEIPEKDIFFDQQDLLGEGAFSQVFRGSYQGSEVAVKRLKVPLSSQDKNYFTAEVSLLRELRHPRVVLLLGVCTTSQHPLMILEYMAQGSLYGYLHDPNNLQLDHAGYYQIAKDMALGMNYLHRHTPVVLHLDLKSMNVLLSTHLRAKIADFGFSKLRYDANQSVAKTSKVHTAGTPAWMAPELLNTGDISTKSDVYSYSIILWEMLTRKHPYEGCSMFQVIERTRTNKRLEIPSYCPYELRNLITRCWSQNPAKRPSFKDILATLEKLQFPCEWRRLFAEAGIPKTILNNVESSRTLIDIVTLTLEDIPRHPDDIPILSLEESDEDTHNNILSGSDDDWEGVTGDDEDSEIDTAQRNAFRPHDVPRLNLNLSGDMNEGRNCSSTKTCRMGDRHENNGNDCYTRSAKHDMTSPMHEAPFFPTTNGAEQLLAQATIPPPPPLDQAPSMAVEAPKLFRHTAAKQKHKVHDTFMEQLELALRDPKPLSKLSNVPSDERKPENSHNLSGFDLRASQLMMQKKRLRSTDQPHPCQLRDLSLVSEEKRKNLFEILRKAVNSRRLQMNDGKSLEQTESTDWSLDD